MKTVFSIACLVPAVILFASCGSTKKTARNTPGGVQEFDQASGTWKSATKIVQPPPPQPSSGAPVVASQTEAIPHHESMWKMPLHWVGLAKDEPVGPPPVQIKPKTEEGKPVKVDDAPPPQPSPIAPKPGHKSLWQRIGDTLKSPFHWGSSNTSGS